MSKTARLGAMSRFSLVSFGIVSVVTLGAVAGIVAISYDQPDPCVPLAPAGQASALVEVVDSEQEAAPPIAYFPTPLVTKGPEISLVREGSGIPAQEGAAVDFYVAAYLGSTGEFLTASSFVEGESVRRTIDAESSDFFERSLACAKAGDRLVVTDTIQNVFGPIPEDEFVQNTSTVVVVVDVVNSFLAQADGEPQWLQAGQPSVVMHPEGFHGVTLPMGRPPEQLQVFTLNRGEGAVLQPGDTAVVNFTGVVWETRQVFASSFDQGVPLNVLLVDGETSGATEGVISGIFDGLVGEQVGSRVAIVVPPAEGYPPGSGPPGVPEGATLVYVFDILGQG